MEHALVAGVAHDDHNVLIQTERENFEHAKFAPLLEQHGEIHVHTPPRRRVYQYILTVSVAQQADVAIHGRNSSGARPFVTRFQPRVGIPSTTAELRHAIEIHQRLELAPSPLQEGAFV